MTEVIGVKFREEGKIYYFDPRGIKVTSGADVIVETSRGIEFGVCASCNEMIEDNMVVQPLRPMLRLATDDDRRQVEENKKKEAEAFVICEKKILEHGLDMKLVEVEYTLDGSKILFFFTSEGRVDFRELVKELAGVFRARIELRQIGVRDEAKMLGGLGICGRPFCCASFLDDFQPVSIKMAKTQNLSLNPTKISGTCGRLMCCLKYEQEAYEDLLRTAPKQDSFVDTPEGRGTVTEVDLLRQRVKVRMEDSPETISIFSNADIAVLRSGKAKKNDPPIPADLAPISGGGKRIRRDRDEDEPVRLEPIRFRYSTENVVDELEETFGEESGEAKAAKSRRRRKPRTDAPKTEQPKAEQQKPEHKADQPKKEQKKEPREAAPKAPREGQNPSDEVKKAATRRRNSSHRRHNNKPKAKPEG